MSSLDDEIAPLPPTRLASVRNGGPSVANNIAEDREKKTGILGFFNKKGE